MVTDKAQKTIFDNAPCYIHHYESPLGGIGKKIKLLELEGTQEQIDNVIIAIERGTYISIDHMDVREMPVDETERGFRTLGW